MQTNKYLVRFPVITKALTPSYLKQKGICKYLTRRRCPNSHRRRELILGQFKQLPEFFALTHARRKLQTRLRRLDLTSLPASSLITSLGPPLQHFLPSSLPFGHAHSPCHATLFFTRRLSCCPTSFTFSTMQAFVFVLPLILYASLESKKWFRSQDVRKRSKRQQHLQPGNHHRTPAKNSINSW